MPDPRYQTLRRLHALSGVVPVACFLAIHFLSNAMAIGGPRAYDRFAAALDSLPGVRVMEVLLIGLPILAHMVLGVVLGNTAQGVDRRHAYPRPWMATAQRATGGYLVVYVIFHVWWTRLSPDLLHGGDRDLFALTRALLQHPAVFFAHALGVVAAAAHLGIGLTGFAHDWAIPPARLARLGLAGFVLLTAIGLNALFAFVSRPARWLEPRPAVAAAPADVSATPAPEARGAPRTEAP